MQRTESRRRVGFSPDLSDKPVVSLRSCIDASPEARRSKRKQISIRLFHFVRSNVARALRRVVSKRRAAAASAKGSSSSSSNTVVPQHYFIPHRDSHHSEAMEDCIKFINSSSSGKSM